MKIRNGFVSNSSSSSFILFFKSEPTSISDIKDMLFNDYEIKNDMVSDDNCNSYPLSFVSKSILEEIKTNMIDFDEMISIIRDDFTYIDKYNIDTLDEFFYGHKYSDEYEVLKNNILIFNNTIDKKISDLYRIYHKETLKEEKQKINTEISKLYQEKYSKQEAISEKIIELLSEILKEKYENYKFSHVEYSDNDGDFCSFMEHGGILDRISILKMNHH